MRALSGTLWFPAVFTAAVLLSGCNSDQKPPEIIRPAIATQPVSLSSLAIETYSGDVRARYESTLGFRIGGKIASRRVDNGVRVKKGEVLATLEPEDASLALSSAQAALAAAEADLNLADAELERHRHLLEKNYISKALFDARANQQKAAKARLDQAQAQVGVARNQTQYTRLLADADGVITAVQAEVGQVVAAGTPVLSLAHAGAMEVEIAIPESRYSDFKPGRSLILELWSASGKRYPGKIREVASEADPVTRTYTVRVAFDDTDESVQLGMTARVFFTDTHTSAAVLIPLSALHEKAGKPAVWVIDPVSHKVNLHEVQIDKFREDGISIVSGLTPNDWIVAAGVHKLVAEQVVKPVDRENRTVMQ